MHKRACFYLAVIFCSLVCVNAEAEDPSGKDYSTALAQIKLTIPADPSVRNYLGLKRESGQISLSEVNADILIIEIFNMYCPYCQLHAPMANKLYQTIRNRKDLKDRVKLIGIGISNSPYEVNIFRQKYSVLFPLFDDKNGSVLDAIPEIRTPHYFAIKKGSGSSIDVFFSKQGPYKDDTIFLDTILKKSGLSL